MHRKLAKPLLCLAAVVAVATAGLVDAAGRLPIRLQTVSFDPVRDGVPDLSAAVPDGPPLRSVVDRYRIVQFASPATAEAQRDLVARGFEVVGALPEQALIVRGGPAEVSVPGIRFAGNFLPGYKVSPGLLPWAEHPARAERAAITAFLFAGEDAGSLAAAVRDGIEHVEIIHVGSGIRPRLDLTLPAQGLRSAVGSLVRDPAVQYVARRPDLMMHNDQGVWIGQSYDRINGPVEASAADPKPYPASGTIWNRGLTGTGQIIAIADSGLEHTMCAFDDPGVPLSMQNVTPPADLMLQPDHRKVLALNAPLIGAYATDDSFRHGTHVAASAVGDNLANAAGNVAAGHDHGDGVAPAARLVFEDVSGTVQSDCFTTVVVTSLADLLEQEYRTGARISSNSWGTSGGDASAAIDGEVAAWEHEDLLVLFSNGNNGDGGLNVFAGCKNCVAVGASENYDATFSDALGILDPENMTQFSSHGPTADGRIKPDVVAPGFRVASSRLPVAYFADEADPACAAGGDVCFPSFGGCYVADTLGTCHVGQLLGTSMATPQVAGLAALARQYFTEGFYPSGAADAGSTLQPRAALLKAVLIHAGRNMTGNRYERRGTPVDFGPLADAPSNVQGWGRVTLDDALYFAGETRRLQLFDLPNANGVTTGEVVTTQFLVASSEEPLKLTLVWTDAPGQPAAGGALVNDLDLELTAPSGAVYRGNQWTTDDINVVGDRESLADAPGRDSVNNVEGLTIKAPQTGLYTARVIGHDVPGDLGVLTQGAALVSSGAIGACTAQLPPQNLSVESFGAASVELSWDPVPGALGYTLYRNNSVCGEPMPADRLQSVGAVSTVIDADVVSNTIHNYTVRARLSVDGCETADSNCVSALTVAGAAPPPIPDGVFAGTPFGVAKGPTPFRLDLSWDSTSCPPEGRHLLYGPLAGAAAQEITGAKCGLSATGSYSWLGVPVEDLWFLVVGSSAGMIEGSWGVGSDGGTRGGGEVSGYCGTVVRDDSGTCP